MRKWFFVDLVLFCKLQRLAEYWIPHPKGDDGGTEWFRDIPEAKLIDCIRVSIRLVRSMYGGEEPPEELR